MSVSVVFIESILNVPRLHCDPFMKCWVLSDFAKIRMEFVELLFSFFAVGCVTLSLYLLPRLKGAIVAYQWAKRLHGFSRTATPAELIESK